MSWSVSNPNYSMEYTSYEFLSIIETMNIDFGEEIFMSYILNYVLNYYELFFV